MTNPDPITTHNSTSQTSKTTVNEMTIESLGEIINKFTENSNKLTNRSFLVSESSDDLKLEKDKIQMKKFSLKKIDLIDSNNSYFTSSFLLNHNISTNKCKWNLSNSLILDNNYKNDKEEEIDVFMLNKKSNYSSLNGSTSSLHSSFSTAFHELNLNKKKKASGTIIKVILIYF
jgi:hypothetical protein